MSDEDQLGAPLDRVRRAALLSRAEEIHLAKRIEQGDPHARERMIESNLRLVIAVASSYRGRGVPFADLVQEGSVGLVHAVERFDYRRGLKFSTYAVWWIRRSVMDALGAGQAIRVPVRASQQLAAVRRVQGELERTGPASNAAIADRTGLNQETVGFLRGAARVTASLDKLVGEDTTTLGELIADDHAVDPAQRAVVTEREREVSAMLALLPRRHREVLVRRYGLDGQPEHGHDEIGQWLGVGAERSRQLEREALHRLRSVADGAALAA
jgi:RNA polymerase primary sigma factor